jgi:hypothetical protein
MIHGERESGGEGEGERKELLQERMRVKGGR